MRKIMMDEYINKYLGKEGISSTNLEKIYLGTHKDLSELEIDYVQKVPFDIVEDGMILEGIILLVEDVKRHVAPYIRPEILREYGSIDIVEYYRSKRKKTSFQPVVIYEEEEMSEEEVYEALEGVFTEEDFMDSAQCIPENNDVIKRKLVNVYKS